MGSIVWAAAVAVWVAAAGARALGRLLTRVLAGFMMTDHTPGASPQHTVMTCEVPRHPAERGPLQAAFRVCG